MYYTIYKTTSLINGKIYIGKHQTSKLNDNYLGSGKGIKNAVKKYGKQNFKKDILFVFASEEEMNAKEKELITEEFVARNDTYNAGIGGEGGPHFKGKSHSTDSIAKRTESRKGINYKKSPEALDNEKQLRYKRNNGKFFSEETIEKIRQKALERHERKRLLRGSEQVSH